MFFNRLTRTSASSVLAICIATAGATLGTTSSAWAQEAPKDTAQAPADITVVGSQIKGAKINGALPVTVISADQIKGAAAVSGDELFRSIPQFGDVRFNSQYLPGSSNGSRGDVGSLDLRSLGIATRWCWSTAAASWPAPPARPMTSSSPSSPTTATPSPSAGSNGSKCCAMARRRFTARTRWPVSSTRC
jgi:hypothetical protein